MLPGAPRYQVRHMNIKCLQYVRCSCFLLRPNFLHGTRYENDFLFFCFFVPCFLQVNLYLYIPLHTLYTRTYIVHIEQCGTRWYEPVIPVTPGAIRGRITSKLHELNTVLDTGRGGRWVVPLNRGLPQPPSRPKSMLFRWRSMDQCRCTNKPTNQQGRK